MADDDDYMSDKFIVNMETCKPPSLILKHSDKRAMALIKKKNAIDERMLTKNKLKNIMEEKREEGLSSAISNSNKGFKMLMKMGYKPGQGIGKNETGRSEPIPMNIKTNRLGLGNINKKPIIKKINTTAKFCDIKTDEYRDRIAMKKLAQLMEYDLIKSQKVCEELDIKSNINEPIELWYWPPIPTTEISSDDSDINNQENNKNEIYNNEEDDNQNKSDENDDMIELSTDIKLDIITKYLRKQYSYCIWCGVPYNNQMDLNDNCPGNTRNDH